MAAGFEHSVANMYFIPVALFVKSDGDWVESTPSLPDLSGLTWDAFVFGDLIPVTIGNIVGGALMVGAVYWFIYLRPAVAAPTD